MIGVTWIFPDWKHINLHEEKLQIQYRPNGEEFEEMVLNPLPKE
jgi:hypothetical protein